MKLSHLLEPFFIIPILGLGSLSLAVLGSSTPSLFFNQLFFGGIGIIFCIIFSRVDYRVYPHIIGFLYITSILLLALTFFGPHVRGATRWIEIGGFRLQSSELTKPFLFICFAYLLSKRPVTRMENLALALFLFTPILLLIFKQPDLGNTIVYTGVFILLLLSSGLRPVYLLLSSALSVLFLPFFWSHLLEYQKNRILSFLNPMSDPKGAGYNALQAIIAIGAGGLAGLGLGRGTQSHLLFLPEFHTDFVFASLAEEFGFLGGGLVLVFYILMLVFILQTMRLTRDGFARLLCIAVFAQILIQVFINVGMNLGILPITGITLPLLSYGGSSLISVYISLGLIQSIKNKARPL